MEENKELQTVSDAENASEEVTENAEIATEVTEKAKPKKVKAKKVKNKKPKLLKNQALFKRGGFSVSITALVLVGLILFNWLIAVLADRFNLEIDMSAQKVNTISEDNIEYIKNVESEIEIIVCANEDDYTTNGYMAYYAQYLYNATGDNASDYYQQTINLINKYPNYNDKISVRYVDPQTTEFTEITTKYSSDSLSYGDIIVTSTVKSKNGAETERHKRIGYTDIYNLTDETGYASMGYGSYTVSGNNIETALTGAIAYVASGVTKRVGIITGHSTSDSTSTYVELLENNNYDVTTVADSIVTEISSELDAVVIAGPTTDFLGSELDVISEFLDNDGKLGKGLIYFGSAANPSLPNLNDFLYQWGIDVREGILFETNSQNHITDDSMTMGVYAADDDITSDLTYCITGYNVPILAGEPTDKSITVTPIYTTLESVVAAPSGTVSGWTGYSDEDMNTYNAVLQAEMSDYDDDNNLISSYVMAFSSLDFMSGQWAEYSQLSNKDISLAITERAAGIEDMGISFISKTITDESYADQVTASGSTAIMIIFMILLPIAMIAIGVVIFIRRRNA